MENETKPTSAAGPEQQRSVERTTSPATSTRLSDPYGALQTILRASDPSLWRDGQLVWMSESPGWLRQRFGSEFYSYNGNERMRVYCECDVIRDIPVTSRTLEIVAAMNQVASYSSLILDPDSKTLRLKASTMCKMGVDWSLPVTQVAAVQVAEARIIAPKLIEYCGGIVDITSEPDKSIKTVFVAGAFADQVGQEPGVQLPDDLIADLRYAQQGLESDQDVLVTCSEDGLACEFPFPGGIPQSALATVQADALHPLLGRGVRVAMRVPRLPEELTLTPAALNDFNVMAFQLQHGQHRWGAWFYDEISPGYTAFVPWSTYGLYQLDSLLNAMRARVDSLHKYLHLPDVRVDVTAEKLRLITEAGLLGSKPRPQ